jgi:hypothetical protein
MPKTNIDNSVIEFKQGFRECADVLYTLDKTELKFSGEWLGWGPADTFYFCLMLPVKIHSEGRDLDESEIQILAERIHRGLTQMKLLHAITRQQEPVPIPQQECESTLLEFQQWMKSQGWEIIFNKDARNFTQKRIPGHESIQQQSANSHEMFKWTQRALECLRGQRFKEKLMYQSTGVKHKTLE